MIATCDVRNKHLKSYKVNVKIDVWKNPELIINNQA